MTRQAKYDFAKFRIKKNMSLIDLSNAMKINPVKVKNIEKHGKKITRENLLSLSKALDVSNEELIFGNDSKILDVTGLTTNQVEVILKIYNTFREEKL